MIVLDMLFLSCDWLRSPAIEEDPINTSLIELYSIYSKRCRIYMYIYGGVGRSREWDAIAYLFCRSNNFASWGYKYALHNITIKNVYAYFTHASYMGIIHNSGKEYYVSKPTGSIKRALAVITGYWNNYYFDWMREAR